MNKSRVFVIGDIHGNYRGLIQCLERSGFDKEKDYLIALGDYVDGWPEVYEVVEELLTIKNLIPLLGNHDDWFRDFILWGFHPDEWRQGGKSTKHSYELHAGNGPLNQHDIPESHQNFFKSLTNYVIDDKNRIFVHAGWNRHDSLAEIRAARPHEFYWDRTLWKAALSAKAGGDTVKIYDNFREIYIGHTATTMWKDANGPITTPMNACNVWNLDTGAGWSGKLTIMNVDTKEYWQSDLCSVLYPNDLGRHG